MKTEDTLDALTYYAATIDTDTIPETVLAKSAELFLDTVGCILAGTGADGIKEMLSAMRIWEGRPVSRVVAQNVRTSPPEAAFLNSVMGHARDYDDTHDAALNHGCVTLVPALLATCEALADRAGRNGGGAAGDTPRDTAGDAPRRGAGGVVSGRDFIGALAVGLDVSNRLGMAFIPYLHVGWLPTTLWGPLACAAACGRLIGLGPEQMRHAFGLAYSQIHGNRQALADGALAKRMQPGFSASAGVKAAFFAEHGLTGARHIIDGRFGIPALYTQGKVDRDRLTHDLGSHFETMEVSVKPYPSCRCTHPVIDAALELAEDHRLQPDDIQSGTIYLPPQSMGQIGAPFTIRDNPTVDAQFSAQYTVALSLVEGRPKIAHFDRSFVTERDDIHRLGARFNVVGFEKQSSSLVPVELKVTCHDGRKLHTRIEHPSGSPAKPIDRSGLLTKLNDCIDNGIKRYGTEGRSRLIESLSTVVVCENVIDIIEMIG